VAAHDVAALVSYRGLSIEEATQQVIAGIGRQGGDGGLIALDPKGNVAMSFNSEGMYRAYIDGRGRRFVGIYR
jgi:beta-aspartyl-peptidase (threonine type)